MSFLLALSLLGPLLLLALACGMAAAEEKPKIGAGHLQAMARLGLAELRAAVSLGLQSVEQPTPYGIFGTLTPGEVAQQKNADPARDQEPALGHEAANVFGPAAAKDEGPAQGREAGPDHGLGGQEQGRSRGRGR